MPVLAQGNTANLTLGAHDSITLQNRAGQSASLTVAGTLVNGQHSGTRTYGPYANGGAVVLVATAGDVYYEVGDGAYAGVSNALVQVDTTGRPIRTVTAEGQVVGGGGDVLLPSLRDANPRATLQAAITANEFANASPASLVPSESGDLIAFDQGISITPSKLSVYGSGQRLDFSAMSSGYAMTLLGFVGDINIASSFHQPHEIKGLHVIGPGTPGVGGLVSEGGATQVHKYQITFRNMVWRNFDVSYRLNRDTWGINWFACHYRPTLTCFAVMDVSRFRPDGQPMTNAGERLSHFGLTALNGGTFLRQTWGNADTHIVNSSIDQFDCVADVFSGKALFHGGHYENLKDGASWFRAWGPNAVIAVRAIDLYLPLGATYNNYSTFESDEACRFGGIDVDGLFTSIGATYNRQTLCHGYGRALAKRVTFLDSSPRPPFSRHMNKVPDGTDVKHWDGWTPMPGVAVQQTASDSVAFGVAPRAGTVVPATFAGRPLVAADVGAVIMANSTGSTGMARIIAVNSATSATVEVLTTFASAGPTVSYHAFFPSDANVPVRANGWSQPFTSGSGLEPAVGDTVTGATSGASMVVTSVRKTSGQWSYAPATVIGSISGSTLTVTGLPRGELAVGAVLTVGGSVVGTISALGTGTGGAGTYTLTGAVAQPAGTTIDAQRPGDAAGVIYGFARTGSFSAGEAWQDNGVTFASVAAGGQATTNYAMQFVGTGTAAQRVERYIPWEPGELFTMAYVADLAGCAAVSKSLSVTLAYCDENKVVIGSTQSAVAASSANGFRSAGAARANVTPAPAGTKFVRLRFEASAATGTGGVINVGDVIINAL